VSAAVGVLGEVLWRDHSETVIGRHPKDGSLQGMVRKAKRLTNVLEECGYAILPAYVAEMAQRYEELLRMAEAAKDAPGIGCGNMRCPECKGDFEGTHVLGDFMAWFNCESGQWRWDLGGRDSNGSYLGTAETLDEAIDGAVRYRNHLASSPPSTHTSDGSPPSVEGGEQTR
jgi:hypothetical protein